MSVVQEDGSGAAAAATAAAAGGRRRMSVVQEGTQAPRRMSVVQEGTQAPRRMSVVQEGTRSSRQRKMSICTPLELVGENGSSGSNSVTLSTLSNSRLTKSDPGPGARRGSIAGG